MKTLLIGLLTLSTISSSFAKDCWKAYDEASSARMNLHTGLYVVAMVGGAASLATPAGVFFILGFGGGAIGSLAHGDAEVSNQFDGIRQALTQSRDGRLNRKAFQKIAGNVKHLAYKDYKVILTDAQISASLNLANDSQAICPLVKIKKNGEEKRAVFNRKALVKYLSDMSSTGSSEAPVITLQD